MKRLLQSLFILMVIATNAIAQDRTITGTVTNKGDGKPLLGVTVRTRGAQGSVQTESNGSYTIKVPSAATALEFSYLGFITVTKPLAGAGNTINVALEDESKVLSEIVVTGYGTTTKQVATGSISTVSGKQIESLPVQTFDRALQGRAAGVQVTTNSGQPGSGITVRVRGVSTVNGGSQPLYIVDGIQIAAGGLSTVTTQNVLGAINPADIESIQILKDAASASIYGSQAANGVVIVTTKRGKQGKTQVKLSVQQGVNKQINPYEMLNSQQYYALRKEAVTNRALRLGNSVATAVTAMNQGFGSATIDPSTLPTEDWYNAIFRNANFGEYNLSASGGNEKTRFFMSGNFNRTQGVALASDYKKGGLRVNLDNQVTDKLSFEANLNIAFTKSVGPSTDGGFFVNTPFTGALFIPPYNTIYMPDGTYRNPPDLRNAQNINIVQHINEEKRNTQSFQTISNLALNYKLLPDLKLRLYAGLDFADAKNYSFRPSSIPAYATTGGSGAESLIRNINYNTSITANYNKVFNNDHNLSLLGGFEFRSNQSETLGASAQGFPSPLFTLISSAATPLTTTSTFTGFKIASLIGNVKYDYKGKYLFTGNIRYDGSSRFGADYKFGLFGGASAGWRIKGEEFLKSVDFLSDLKLRGSFGVVGTQPGSDFGAISLYNSPGAAGAYNGLASIRPSQLANPLLTWEQQQQIGLGLDMGFFNNRITAAVDIYKKKTTKLLLDRTLPSNSGFTSIRENGGRLDGKGIDIELNTINLDLENGFKWTTMFNIAFFRNKLIELNNGAQRIGTSYIVGKPTNILYSFEYAGVNAADGRPMFYDVNGNITYVPLANTDDRILGYANPSSFGGFGNTFSYKGLTLDVLFQYQYGNSTYLQTGQILEASGMALENQVVSQLNRWTTPGQITAVPRAYDGYTEPGGYDPTNLSSRYVQKSSYIRLKQITLNYKLPTAWTSKIGVQGVSLFVQGLNLATISNYRGEDPENTGNNLNGYPQPKTIAGGITIDL
ncbi:TonB-dependent receptor [Pedobacter sp. Hv1]|uniref:SusC/RagA family TonB-linked outer membrane protein n=1 Tax=Pedobacter sp. Hv1 TaxID=1740090 RepID=UPI0009EA4862|nr:TonB-dependent receptor [Pedobacter sp. Hv1]